MKSYMIDFVAHFCVSIFAYHYTQNVWATIAAVLFAAIYGAWNFYDGIQKGSPGRLLKKVEQK